MMQNHTQLPERTGESPSFAELFGRIVDDVQTLVRQEMRLIRIEFAKEAKEAKHAAFAFGTAVYVCGAAGLLALGAVVHGLIAAGLPAWASYLIVAVATAISGRLLYQRAYRLVKEVDPLPTQAVERVKENVQWIREQT